MAAPFRFSHRVTYSDCTVGDHIYYSRYLDLLEAARGEFFRECGCSFREWQTRDVIFPVVECHLRYRAPARYDDELTVELKITQCAGARLTFGYQVCNQKGQLIIEGETHHVCANIAGVPKRLPKELVAKLA
jgi:acyl-CoA thioester hydrolase